MFLEQIADCLDQFSKNDKFNRLVFDHIVEFGNFIHDAPILLSDFFELYCVVYETMKINRIEIGKDCYNLKTNIEIVNSKMLKHLKTEKMFENGLTSNSKLKITIKNLHDALLNKNYVLNINIVGEGTFKEIQLLESNVNKKFKL